MFVQVNYHRGRLPGDYSTAYIGVRRYFEVIGGVSVFENSFLHQHIHYSFYIAYICVGVIP